MVQKRNLPVDWLCRVRPALLYGIAAILFLLSALPVATQITTSVNVRTPTPPRISEWQRDASVIQIFLVNSSATEFRNVRISFFIRDVETGRVVARTDDAHPQMPRFTIPSRGSLSLNGSQVIRQEAIDVDPSLERLAITTGELPEGTYEYCAEVISETGESLSTTGPACRTFRIIFSDPPDLIYPIENRSIAGTPYPVFRWTPVVLPGATIQYRVVVKARLEGQSPRQALESNGRSLTLFEGTVPTNSHSWTPADRRFDDPTLRTSRFVWQVQSVNSVTGEPIGRNGGLSSIGEFNNGSSGSSSGRMELTPHFPLDNDTIPWQVPHLIVRWGDFDPDINRMTYTLTVRNGSGSVVGTNSRTLNWSGGVLESQGVTTVDRARLIIVSFTNSCESPGWMNSLQRGTRYSWTVEATFRRNDGSETTMTSRSASFVTGLRRPENREPNDGSAIAPGSEVTLRWDAPSPRQADFQPTELLTRYRNQGCMQFSYAFEEMKLEVSRRADFSTTIATDQISLPGDRPQLVTGEEISSLFAPQSHDLGRLTDTGTYYWRISYLDASGSSYATGPVWRFRIGSGASGDDRGDVTAEECIRMIPGSPERNGTWSAGRRPLFSVLTRPVINLDAVTGGRLRVWRMSSATEDSTEVMRRSTAFDQSFSRSEVSTSLRAGSSLEGTLPIDIPMLNESDSRYTFEGDSGASYLWTFTLEYDGSRIRGDSVACSRSMSSTIASRFTIDEGGSRGSDSGACADICSIDSVTDRTPSTRSYRNGDEIDVGRFRMRLTRVSGTGGALSGEGEIAVPFLNNVKIQVSFSGISVNNANRMYNGRINAKHDPTSPLSEEDANRLSGALGITEAQSQSLNSLVSDAGRLVSFLSGSSMSLPLGFDNVVEGERIVVGIVGMIFTSTDARFNATAHVDVAELGPDVGFGLQARDICFHPGGIGGDGRAILALANDHGYRQPGAWSFLFKAPSSSDSGTAIAFDCNGFSWLRIHAEVEFPKEWMTKAEPANAADTGLVTASFITTIRRTGDFIAHATMDPFAPTDAPELKIAVEDIVLDLSNHDNPVGITFPTNFRGDRTNRFRGFYIRRASVALPEALRTFDSTRPMRLEANNLIIDFRGGVNFNLDLVNVIQYPRGDFGGWGASIDTLGIAFVNSSLENGHMSGRLKLPISDSALDYRATLGVATRDTSRSGSGADSASSGGGLQFTFSIVPRDTIRADLWAASMRLNPTSRIDLRAGGGRDFYIGATLSGSIGISGDVGGVPGLNFTNMEFENMRLQSVEPYFDPGRWPNSFGHASPQHSTAGFPVSISNLNVVTGERDRGFGAGLQFTLSVNISGGGEGEEGSGSAISGGTTLSIWGVLVNDGGGQSFEFDGVDLDSVGVAADLGAVQIAGGIRLYRRDPVFGTGFRGALSATFAKQVTVNVTAQFGSVGEGSDEYRYWYVDALARFEPGFMIFTGVGIYGFGGGAWYHMRKESMSASAEQAMLASATTGGSVNADSANPGRTNSGYRFVPDRGEAFGFRAMVTLGTFPKPDAFNADVYFEMSFLEGGGVGRITIGGDGFIMAGLNERSQAKVTANAEMTYNFPAETFDGHFRFSINASPLTGGGEIVMHASPRTWFFKAGTPDRRITVSLADWIEINTYLMVGKGLPFPMSLPPEIKSVLGDIPPMRSPAITQGDGFAFGAMASFNFDPPPFLIFYAEIAFTLGFDLGLLNNGDAAVCEETGEPMGVNGWYALGQFYAYMAGSMGIEVDLWFVSGKFEIFGFEVAALLRGGAPNPAWLQGVIAGSYRLFGGAITGNCRFEFEVGEECTPMRENPLAELGLVSDLQPADGTLDVPFDVEPRAAFNFKIDDRFDITEMRDDGSQRVRTFRVKVREFTIDEQNGSSWRRLGSSYRLISDRSQASLIPNRGLRGEIWHRTTVKAYGEEYTRGSWQTARKLDGTPVDNTMSVQFLTAPPPDTITPSNVRIAYPRDRQRHFLQDECPTGSIDLHREVDYLFTASPPAGYRYTHHARFVPIPAGTPPIEVDARYRSSSSGGRVEYNMPTLPNNQIFALQIIRRRVRSGGGSTLPTFAEGRDYSERHSATARYGVMRTRMTLQSFLREWNVDSNSMTQSDRRVTGFQMSRQTAPSDDLLFVYNFQTSRYDRLADKLNALSFTEVRVYPPFGILELQEAKHSGAELFDNFDLEGKSYMRYGRTHLVPPLIGVEANRRIRTWHTRYTNPWIYDILDLVERLRRRNIYTNFERQARRGRLAEYVRGASGELSDNEISPPPPPSGGSGSSGGRYAGVGTGFTGMGWSPPPPSSAYAYTPTITYAYRHGTTIPLDYFMMRREVARLLACCSGEFMNSADEARLRQALARSYSMMYTRLDYGIDFYYNYCYDPDTPPRRIEERFRLP